MNYYIRLTGVASQTIIDKLIYEGFITEEIALLTGLFCNYSEYDIELGHTFKYLILYDSDKKIELKATVKFAIQAQGLHYTNIPQGHKTLSFFETSDSDLLKKILPLREGWDYTPERVYLSDVSELVLLV